MSYVTSLLNKLNFLILNNDPFHIQERLYRMYSFHTVKTLVNWIKLYDLRTVLNYWYRYRAFVEDNWTVQASKYFFKTFATPFDVIFWPGSPKLVLGWDHCAILGPTYLWLFFPDKISILELGTFPDLQTESVTLNLNVIDSFFYYSCVIMKIIYRITIVSLCRKPYVAYRWSTLL